MIKYTGFIRKIRYYSESSHYIVALLEVEEEQKTDYDEWLYVKF